MAKQYMYASVCSKCNEIIHLSQDKSLFMALCGTDICPNCGAENKDSLRPKWGEPFVVKKCTVDMGFLDMFPKVKLLEDEK